jgi:hypothetical protein
MIFKIFDIVWWKVEGLPLDLVSTQKLYPLYNMHTITIGSEILFDKGLTFINGGFTLQAPFGNKLPAASPISLSVPDESQRQEIAQLVTHPGNNHAQLCLISVIHRDLEHLKCYRRNNFVVLYQPLFGFGL